MKLQRYDVHLTYVPGKEMYISDALSRAYLEESTETLIDEDLDVNFVERELPMTSEKIAQLKQHTATDEQLQLLADIVAKGWPEKHRAVPHSIRAYWNYRDEIAYIEGLMYRGSRIIIPSALRRDMLNKLHEPHLGIVKTKQRARSVIFWPNMNQDIERLIEKCDICNKHRKANPHQPLIPHDIPELPWSKVGADLHLYSSSRTMNIYFVSINTPNIRKSYSYRISRQQQRYRRSNPCLRDMEYRPNFSQATDLSSLTQISRNLRVSGSLLIQRRVRVIHVLMDRQNVAFKPWKTYFAKQKITEMAYT